MNAKELAALGVPHGKTMKAAFEAVAAAAAQGIDRVQIEARIAAVAAGPEAFYGDAVFGGLAAAMSGGRTPAPRSEPIPWRQWGTDLEPDSVTQMRNACRLPVSVAGALMPDAHPGYGLPIGGVLATEGAVIPYAVGMDIACRMKMTVFDLPTTALENQADRLKDALLRETRFGVGATFKGRREHRVMDADWSVTKLTERFKDRAWSQLGTSGSGNHFVEFGTLTVTDAAAGLSPGLYLAVLSHSGSRGTGAAIAQHYSKVAMDIHRDLPRDLIQLAWLDLDSEAGIEYWNAMELMGRYASANHELIHRHIAKALGVEVILDVENHHNFAWKEVHGGREVIVHRKGATPAGTGVFGVIPGSMATPGYVVRGRGNPDSLNSASHGAGRRMSRTEAKKRFSRREMDEFLKRRGVTLLSAGLDEAPMAYKDIEEVMAAQTDLVEPLARFDPKLVRMAGPGEKPED